MKDALVRLSEVAVLRNCSNCLYGADPPATPLLPPHRPRRLPQVKKYMVRASFIAWSRGATATVKVIWN